MGSEDQLHLDRIAAKKPESPTRVEPGVKTILIHVQNDKVLDQTLETALATH